MTGFYPVEEVGKGVGVGGQTGVLGGKADPRTKSQSDLREMKTYRPSLGMQNPCLPTLEVRSLGLDVPALTH